MLWDNVTKPTGTAQLTWKKSKKLKLRVLEHLPLFL